jgi:hypothetical protein
MKTKPGHYVRTDRPIVKDDGTLTDIDGFAAAETVNAVVDRTGGVMFEMMRLPSYLKAKLPPAANGPGLIFVSDATGGAEPAFSDGVDWRRCSDRTVIS